MMPITMGQAAAGFLKYLAEPAARSLALGCLAAIALAAFRVKRVGLRLFVWTMALYAALAMPFLGAFLPKMAVPVPAQTAALVQSVEHSFAQSFRRGVVRTAQAEGAGSSVLASRVTSAAAAAHDDIEAISGDARPPHTASVRRQQ
ncbi:MAG TPA: hypothetical protein VGR84_15165, partial [Candidatus Acidoferrales bacterium]|nr:hypothetical protein [Candidatus Acidoferrales bacterium]